MHEYATIVIATSLVAASASVLITEWLRKALVSGAAGKTDMAGAAGTGAATVQMLFDDDKLVDATPGAELVLASSESGGEPESLDEVLLRLEPRFPDLCATLDGLGPQGRVEILACDGSIRLEASREGDTLRICLDSEARNRQTVAIGLCELDAIRAEIGALRAVASSLPYPVWRTDSNGAVDWANRAYLDLCRATGAIAEGPIWPVPRLFVFPAAAQGNGVLGKRLWIEKEGVDDPSPYEVTAVPQHSGHLCSAIPADGAVRTETSMRDFVQTLTKTFAQISIGLAVFSRDRRMVLFNPALTDLTGVRAEALALRPTLFEFLDSLRDRRMVPEPKDYKSWRNRLAQLTANANGGGLSETWQMPDGRSFRVAALPQPEGAMALLFEDITSQMIQSRHFRGTLEMLQIVLDRRHEAIVVFAPDGALVLCNDPYDALWGTDLAETVAPVSFEESLQLWKSGTRPDPVWGDFPRSAAGTDAASPDGWAARFILNDGRKLDCRASVLPGNCLMVEFHTARAETETVGPHPMRRRLQLTG